MTSMRLAAVAAGAAAMLSACGSDNGVASWINERTGTKNDEYRIVRNQPLLVPPGFDLRPPRDGGPELRRAGATTVQARRTVVGSPAPSTAGAAPGAAEQAIVRRARSGVTAAGGYVRKDVDEETTKQKDSEQKFTDKLLKWEKRAGADTRKIPLGGNTDPVIKREGEIF